jgi:hypothetical protein
MADRPTYGVADIYTEYVKRRQNGGAMEDVVRELQPYADQLDKNERRQLGQLVQSWEANDGINYKAAQRRSPALTEQLPNSAQGSGMYNPANDPYATNTIPQPKNAANRANPPVRTIEATGPAGDPEQRQVCPHCGRLNHKKDSYCYACGHILTASRSVGTKALEEDMDPKTRWGTAHFGQASALSLTVRGATKPIEVVPQGELIIGRSAAGSAMQPDIDLAAYNAENLGVSRLHASLKRQDNTVSITDLDSKNHTFINGQRLHPHEVRVLRDGDEIRLGKLIIKVSFKHQLRRI